MTTRRIASLRGAARSRTIEKIYLAIGDHGDGEGVYTVPGQEEDERLPMVAVDDTGLSILKKLSQDIATSSGKTVSIICFTTRVLHDTLPPLTTGDDNS